MSGRAALADTLAAFRSGALFQPGHHGFLMDRFPKQRSVFGAPVLYYRLGNRTNLWQSQRVVRELKTGGVMLLKLATAVAIVAAIVSSPALACMGNTVLYTDNFQQQGAWGVPSGTPPLATLTFGNGVMTLTPPVTYWWAEEYLGAFFDAADACIDVTTPSAGDPTQLTGGFIFGNDPNGNFMVLIIEADGYATVAKFSNAGNGAFIHPVPWQQSALVKTGLNATNTLRVTWSGSSGTAYINGQQFATFPIVPPFQNTTIGTYASGDTGAAGATMAAAWQYANLKITNVASK